MAKRRPIERALAEETRDFERLSREETTALQQRWRETFAQRVRRATGEWTYLDFDWHAFSYEFVYCLSREHARSAYSKRKAPEFVVLPHQDKEFGYRVRSAGLPMLGGLDAYVCPVDFEWTMVFTHEEDWCGPYFTTAEWANKLEPTGDHAG